MVSSAIPSGSRRTEEARARSLGILSLLMVPLLLVTFAVSFVVQEVILGTQDLEGSEPMSQQGAIGWLSFGLGMLIFLAPLAAGVFLGARARKLGATRLGWTGMLVDGALFVGLFVPLFISTLNQ